MEDDRYIATDTWLYSSVTGQYIIDPIKFNSLKGYPFFEEIDVEGMGDIAISLYENLPTHSIGRIFPM